MSSKIKTTVIVVGIIALVLFLFNSLDLQINNSEAGSIYNESALGAAALPLWFDKIGYQTESYEYRRFDDLDQEINVMISLPSERFDGWQVAEVDAVLRWVEETGATLIIVDDQQNGIFTRLDLTVKAVEGFDPVSTQKPSHGLINPEVTSFDQYQTLAYFERKSPNSQVIVGTEQQPTLLGISRGSGMIYASTNGMLFTNIGLFSESNARLILNLVNRTPAGGTIAFDEVHHGRALPPKAAPVPAKPYSPLVAAMLYSAIVVGLWALFSGRRFGQVVPSKIDLMQRNSSEYVQSMANLFQRGRQAEHMQTHYKTYLKRRIAKPYGINPKLDDQQFIYEVQRYSETIDRNHLAHLLNQLSQPNPSEATILALVSDIDRFIQIWEQQGRV
ncbi:DUF4350 domain-containing protein [Herpetosiphon geysericola]|uniref:DUF4350 domain-containing protein n=1 Tax=Herpetosiphon geysericola TaxID=70996 RepID=A0A0P6XE82_9CHLR|nr:DUF4350 domain-containing protein [Herpetosiphon geysericola]KPL81398.1 hypothetical protein SE18_22400 [Herpetosiphon geysericola]